jgi:hypothetical protein
LQPGRDTKAELNRRSQVCEALAGTGVRVAKMELIVVVGFLKRRNNPAMTIPAELVQRLATAKSVTVLTIALEGARSSQFFGTVFCPQPGLRIAKRGDAAFRGYTSAWRLSTSYAALEMEYETHLSAGSTATENDRNGAW